MLSASPWARPDIEDASAFTKRERKTLAPFQLTTKRPQLAAFFVDESQRCGADSLTAAHLSLRDKMPLVDLDLVLV